ncbi:hypothetical protein [Merismopedia glauca]|uniref:Uncharacterized protein n=1 Tax=Merismopedia glauca CCAP 1448/3 TaxID=1296344 RepID=A0A2T1C589_9CYAN|nr:hypothetical protein [Merismopedia glauca]PSB03429.1 hypothetical protein C7B64_08435 [Merismopedia glauca CCAP 1448/3]
MTSSIPFKIGQSVWASVVAVSCFVAVVQLQTPRLEKLRTGDSLNTPEVLKRETAADKQRLQLWQKVPGFGFDNLVADWIFLQFVQYFGDENARDVTGYQNSPDYFDTIINRDPKFLYPYFYLSTSVAGYLGMPEKSIALMNEGLKSVSPKVPDRAYYIWRYKGLDELLYLGDGKTAQKSFAKATEWARQYSDDESRNFAEISQASADFLARNPASKIAQVGNWEIVLRSAVDKRTRDRAIREIQRLGGKVNISPEGQLTITLPKQD